MGKRSSLDSEEQEYPFEELILPQNTSDDVLS